MDKLQTVMKHLTQTASHDRAQLIASPISYFLLITEDKSPKYSGLLKISFTLKTLPPHLFLDYEGSHIESITVNSKSLEKSPEGSYSNVWNGYNLLINPQYLSIGFNEIIIEFVNNYTKDGNGFHSFVDVDGKQYNYTNLEPDHCHKWFPCFDQPDIKGTFELAVAVPKDWVAISNELIKKKEQFTIEGLTAVLHEQKLKVNEKFVNNLNNSFDVHLFYKSKVLPTYLFALISGPFTEHKCKNPYKNIPMSIYCRESLSQFMASQEDCMFEFLNKGIEFYEGFFGYPYPFSKYDQIFCPEFNVGAMENPGAVTFNDLYIFKGEASMERICRRGRTIVHELAHMWFGDLVTMKWWNDLWLNESFADFAAITCMKNCKYSFPTADFTVMGHLMKSWGYIEDQNKTTHPIAGEVRDTAEAESIFDGITYSKGSSVILQLYYLMGRETFCAALKKYFKKYEWSNTVLDDFINTLDEEFPKNAGFSLNDWYKEWICTAGLNECEVQWVDENKLKISQTSSLKEFPQLRRHKMKVALFHKNGSFETVDVLLKNGPETEVELKLKDYCAALPNYADETFIKICLDKTSLEFFKENLNLVVESGARILIWRAFYDMVRDAKIASSEFIELVSRYIFQEQEMTVLSYVLTFAGNAVSGFTPMEYKKKYHHILFEEVYKNLINNEKINQEDEIIFKGKLLSFADDEEDVHKLLLWYNGENKELGRFKLSLENEWSIVTQIHYSKKYSNEEKKAVLEKQIKKDNSDQAKRVEKQCFAILANKEEKDLLWKRFVVQDLNESEKIMAALMNGFNHEDAYPENNRFIDLFFENIVMVYEKSSSIYANSFFDHLYPRSSEIELLLKKNMEVLTKIPEGGLSQLVRQLKDTTDSLERKLRCFARFEQSLKK